MIRATTSARSRVVRAKIALGAAAGMSHAEIIDYSGASGFTVSKWCKRFSLYGVGTLSDAPRSGTPRTHDDEKISEIIRLTTTTEPSDATHWSTNSMARAANVSQSTVSRLWRAFGLKPHLMQYYTISADPYFTEKVRDVVGLYINPPDAALVLALDEKTQIQALNGTINLYAALDVAPGKVIAKLTKSHRAAELVAFLTEEDKAVPKELACHVILDNDGTHKSEAVRKWLVAHPRFHFHFTPTYSSGMNLVEGWFSELNTKLLRRSAHRSVAELTASIKNWTGTWNENPRAFKWTKTADEIFASMARYLDPLTTERTSD